MTMTLAGRRGRLLPKSHTHHANPHYTHIPLSTAHRLRRHGPSPTSNVFRVASLNSNFAPLLGIPLLPCPLLHSTHPTHLNASCPGSSAKQDGCSSSRRRGRSDCRPGGALAFGPTGRCRCKWARRSEEANNQVAAAIDPSP